jgi:hypothetical protein
MLEIDENTYNEMKTAFSSLLNTPLPPFELDQYHVDNIRCPKVFKQSGLHPGYAWRLLKDFAGQLLLRDYIYTNYYQGEPGEGVIKFWKTNRDANYIYVGYLDGTPQSIEINEISYKQIDVGLDIDNHEYYKAPGLHPGYAEMLINDGYPIVLYRYNNPSDDEIARGYVVLN